MKSKSLTLHDLLYPNNFDVAVDENNACRNFYVKLGRLRNDQVHGPQVTKGRSKTSKTRSFNDRTRFCPMPIVTWVTPGTVDVIINDAAQR